MKKGMIVLIVVILGLIIMSSALKPRENNTKVQTVIDESMNMAVVNNKDEKQLPLYMKNKKIDHEKYENIMVQKIQIIKETLEEEYKKEIVLEANWGHGEGEYWYYGDSPMVGPGPIAIDENGNIYIHDGAHKRVIKYNNRGKYIKSIKIDIFNDIFCIVNGVIYGRTFERYEGGKEIKGQYGEYYIIGVDVNTEKELMRVKAFGGFNINAQIEGKDIVVFNNEEKYILKIEKNTLEYLGKSKSVEDKQLYEKIKKKIQKIVNYIRLDNIEYEKAKVYYEKIGEDEIGNTYYKLDIKVIYFNDPRKDFYDRIDDSKIYTEIQKYSKDGKLLAIIEIDKEYIDFFEIRNNEVIDKEGNIYYFNPEIKSTEAQFGYTLDPQYIKMYKYIRIK